MNYLKQIIVIVLVLLLSGCASLQSSFETPIVSLTSFRLLPSESMAPRFEIGLHIINPNLMPLPLKGISYNVTLEGHQLLKGVTGDLPVISGYGEADIVLQATADLFSGLRLLSDLMAQPRDSFNYELIAKLDLGSMLPIIRVRESGEVLLQQLQSR